MTTVMVTGVGAIIGYGVLRSLRSARPDVRLVGTDIYPDAVGQHWCDTFLHAPYTSDERYADWLLDQTTRHRVDLVIPGIEQDVDFLSDHPDTVSELSCRAVVNNRELILKSRDKWAMDVELSGLDDPARILSMNSGNFDSLAKLLGVPFLLKPRRGYASKGIVKISDAVTFAGFSQRLGVDLIAQQIVGTNDDEFTVSIFGDGTGGYDAISCLRRKLGPEGSTAHARTEDIAVVAGTASRLCSHFHPEGPTNLQFRKTSEDWKLLEINPRISSSTSIRTAFGYNEAAMCLDYYLDGIRPHQPRIKMGSASRYIEDLVTHDSDHL